LNDFISANHRNYLRYQRNLRDVPGVHLVDYDENEQNNYQYVVLEIDEDLVRVNRDQIVAILHAENILARRYFYPGCHRMKPYSSSPLRLPLPHTERLVRRLMTLPTGEALSEDHVDQICDLLALVVQNGTEVQECMSPLQRQLA
jgi:dTDP-4-amino-4,6-dideoxygalactose transaminase